MLDAPSYAPAGLQHEWDAATAMYNKRPDNLKQFNNSMGLVQSGLGASNAVFVGDSGLIGYNGAGTGLGATGYQSAYSIPKQFAAELAAHVDAVQPGQQGLALAMAAGQVSVGDRWVTSGAWSQTNSAQLAAFTGVGSDEYTSLDKGTAVDLIYSDLSPSFTYQIDGGTAVAVTTGGTSTLKKVTVTGLASATHKVKVNTAAGNSWIAAARVYTPGLQQLSVHNMALGGSWANHSAVAGKNWSDSGPTGLLGTTQAILTLCGIVPDLVVCSVGGNDLSVGEPTANIIAGITGLRNAWPNASFVIMNAWMVQGGNVADYEALAAAKMTLADTLDVPLYDWNWEVGQRAGAAAVTPSRIGADGSHENSAESLRVGRHLARALAQAA